MCPYRSERQWRQLREFYPDDFAKAAALEREINARDEQGGLWLTNHRQPLESIEFTTFGDVGHCDSGFCWV